MANPSSHENIRLKITAFLFNKRADALRGEMYQALCLEAFENSDEIIPKDEIVKRVANALGDNVKITDSLRTIVYDELHQLEKDGYLIANNGGYEIDKQANLAIIRDLQENNPHKTLENVLYQPIKDISLAINPNLKPALIKNLVAFFIKAASLIAEGQTSSLAKGKYGPQNGAEKENPEIGTEIESLWNEYQFDGLDFEVFISKSLLHPEGELANFLYKLVQVNIITQLLSWDPDLEFIKKSILSNKILYLDSSALFLITQENHPMHHFFVALLKTSQHELGVTLRVHESTIKEYKNAIDSADKENRYSYKTLKEIADLCRKEGTSPFDVLESSILADYVTGNFEHLDLGSWQTYITKVSGRRFHETLTYMPVEIDKSSVYIPDIQKFKDINSLMLQASKKQVEKGKRTYLKKDTEHDTRIFYLISGTRQRAIENQGDISVGYDKYLLTLDGSLVYFSQLYRIPISETYFIYPNQWYEITFPFLRLNKEELPQIVSGLATMIYSRAFPKLTSLIPLELCKYIFENGGLGLSIGSIRAIAEALAEERLIDSLRSNNDDIKKQEEAKLRVERIVAQEKIRKNKELQDVQQKAQKLQETHKQLLEQVGGLSAEKEKISEEVAQKKQESGQIDDLRNQMLNMKTEYESRLEKTKDSLSAELKKSREESENEINALKIERAKERLQNRRIVSSLLMTFGLLAGVFWLYGANVSVWWLLGFITAMFIGTIAYFATTKFVILILTCIIGLVITLLSMQTKLEPLLAIGALAWSIITSFVDWVLKEKK